MRPEHLLGLELAFVSVLLVAIHRIARDGVLGESTPPETWAGLVVLVLVMFLATWWIGNRL